MSKVELPTSSLVQSPSESILLTWGAGVLTVGLLIALLVAYKLIEWDVKTYGWVRIVANIRSALKATTETVLFIACSVIVIFLAGLVVVGLPFWIGTAVLGMFRLNL